MITTIILAAGESTRMGAHKMLLPYNGRTVIEHIVKEVGESPISEIVVVTGHNATDVTDCLTDSTARIVLNEHYREGMLSSVRCGLGEMSPESTAALICLGDQPSLRTQTITTLLDHHATSEKGILVPTYNDKRGHPLLIAAHYREEILTHYDDVGLRGLLQAHPNDLETLPLNTDAILQDIDTPEDYQAALRALG